jgi:hypothetical protein
MRRAVVLLVLLAGFVVLSCQQISLRTSADDLGRHIRDGQVILAGHAADILHRNFYSYIHPDSTFLNHHWLMTVLFFLLWKPLGFPGLSAAYIAIGAVAFWLAFRIAEREAGFGMAAVIAALYLPLVSLRAGVRPEIFSTLLLWIFFTILWRIYRGEIRAVWIWSLPALEILWVNLHPGFALGPVLIGTFLLAALRFPNPAGVRNLAISLVLSIAAALANPNGLAGLLFPFTVSQNYGVDVRENLSPFRLSATWLTGMIVAAAVIAFAGYFLAWRRRAKIEWPLALFTLALAIASLLFYRIYVFFAPFAFLSACVNLRAIATPKLRPFALVAMWVAALISAAIFMDSRWDSVGLDQAPNDATLAAFLIANNIQGRVFNEYGTGGYLIFYFPDQRIYVDSRPEAYPADFLRDEYMLPLTDESAWHRIAAKYDFDYICFARLSKNEGDFVIRRIHDPEWALVSGGSDVVLVRRKPQFADLIARREIKFQ